MRASKARWPRVRILRIQTKYRAENIFWVPPEARWSHLKSQARQPIIGQLVDGAMTGIERDNPVLKDVLPKDYARPALDKQRLGQLIDMIGNIQVGDADARSRDVLGRVYEYFLSQFASAEGKKGGEFYTPRWRREAPGQDAKAVQGPGVTIRAAAPRACLCSRTNSFEPTPAETATVAGAWRHLDLRSGIELHDVAAREDEFGHSGDRGTDCPRHQLP